MDRQVLNIVRHVKLLQLCYSIPECFKMGTRLGMTGDGRGRHLCIFISRWTPTLVGYSCATLLCFEWECSARIVNVRTLDFVMLAFVSLTYKLCDIVVHGDGEHCRAAGAAALYLSIIPSSSSPLPRKLCKAWGLCSAKERDVCVNWSWRICPRRRVLRAFDCFYERSTEAVPRRGRTLCFFFPELPFRKRFCPSSRKKKPVFNACWLWQIPMWLQSRMRQVSVF